MITAVVCSDDRMIFVLKKLSSCMETIRIDEHTDFLALPTLDALILPVKGIDEDGYIQIQGKACKIPAMFWKIQHDIRVFSGMPTPYIQALPVEKLYYMEDEDVIRENAILTAEGVLHLLITSIEKSLYDIQVDVVGYGNCGKAIYQMLKDLDVNVRVIRRDCIENGEFIKLSSWTTCGDVIVNTSIQPVISPELMEKWNSQPVVLDIASPDLIDHHAAKKLGINLSREPNLPGRFCAQSAGKIIACYVRGKLKDER